MDISLEIFYKDCCSYCRIVLTNDCDTINICRKSSDKCKPSLKCTKFLDEKYINMIQITNKYWYNDLIIIIKLQKICNYKI